MENHADFSRAALSSEPGFDGLIGESAPMHRLYELIGKVCQSTSPVLLIGETGTGKELVARAIHFTGLRRKKALVPIDCSALTPTLVESELFGHVKGAFTGADHSKRGLLQTANEGTIFLDEIGELPIFLQAKLLRALQEKEIKPVGSTERIPINVRVFAATNRAPDSNELIPLEEIERRAILHALRETGGDRLAAARLLGISKSTLYRKVKQYRADPWRPSRSACLET